MFGSVQRAYDMGAAGVGATIYFGSEQGRRQLVETARAFEEAHRLGMFTVLWCYLRNDDFKKDGTDYSLAADLTGQANHMGVTIEADIIKQKLPENNGGFEAIGFGKTNPAMYDKLTHRPPDRPDPLPADQLLHGPRGADQQRRRVVGRERSGRGRTHRRDQQARRRHGPDLGPQGLPAATDEGIGLLNAIQDVYLNEVTSPIAYVTFRTGWARRCSGRLCNRLCGCGSR